MCPVQFESVWFPCADLMANCNLFQTTQSSKMFQINVYHLWRSVSLSAYCIVCNNSGTVHWDHCLWSVFALALITSRVCVCDVWSAIVNLWTVRCFKHCLNDVSHLFHFQWGSSIYFLLIWITTCLCILRDLVVAFGLLPVVVISCVNRNSVCW
jgi:hypothetical protein